MRKMTMRFRFPAYLAVALVMSGCASTGPRTFESGDALFAAAMQQVEDEDWAEAILLLERLKLEYPTHARIQEARFQLGKSFFAREEYLTAANEHLRLATDYPTGPYADDARFGVCEAYRELSPIVQRDQQYTQGAIEHCQALISFYPTSEFTPRAQQIVEEMTNKLGEKLFIAGEFYRQRQAFDSAIIYYERVLTEYPRTPIAPESLVQLMAVYERLGYTDEARGARERLLRDYPETPQARALAAATPPATGA